jgi:hypothetical protein
VKQCLIKGIISRYESARIVGSLAKGISVLDATIIFLHMVTGKSEKSERDIDESEYGWTYCKIQMGIVSGCSCDVVCVCINKGV